MKTLFSFPLLAVPVLCVGFLSFGLEPDNNSRAHESSAVKLDTMVPKEGGIGIGTFTRPKENGDEVLQITVIDEKGKKVRKKAATGEFGSNNKSDDIKKTMSASEKAQKIVDAINNGEETKDVLIAVRAGHVVTVEAKSPYKGVYSITMNNNTRQKKNSIKVSFPQRAKSRSIPEPDPEIARLIMIGGIAGLDDDGSPAEVAAGTERWSGTWITQNFGSLEELINQICTDLQANGIQAVLENPYSIKITLDPTLDGGVVYGNTDLAIHQMASSGGEAP